VPNLQVIKLMQSFTSRELVKEQFAWRHYYWYLTNEGIEYLREYLNLPAEIVPATLKKSTRPMERRPPMGDRPPREGGGFGRGGDRGDRGGYRSGPPREGGGFGRGGDRGDRGGYRSGPPREGGGFGRGGDKGGAPGEYNPEFRGGGGGFGRGGGGRGFGAGAQ